MKTLWNHDIKNPVFVSEWPCGHRSNPTDAVSKLKRDCDQPECDPFRKSKEGE